MTVMLLIVHTTQNIIVIDHIMVVFFFYPLDFLIVDFFTIESFQTKKFILKCVNVTLLCRFRII